MLRDRPYLAPTNPVQLGLLALDPWLLRAPHLTMPEAAVWVGAIAVTVARLVSRRRAATSRTSPGMINDGPTP